ncbi:MAG: M13 family peptidase, partial [Clostridia bacterium]|nr:M13 family peptidase [Clostridia bacterium]
MEKLRIQDDLYHYVNQQKLDELVIPDDAPSAGGFKTLHDEVEKLMIQEFNDLCQSKNYPNVNLERACNLYMAVKDVKRRNRFGIRPALKFLQPIKKLDSVKALN